jgi:hypothetical protein
LGLISGSMSGIDLAGAHGLGVGTTGAATASFVAVAIIAGNVTVLKAQWARIAEMLEIGGLAAPLPTRSLASDPRHAPGPERVLRPCPSGTP